MPGSSMAFPASALWPEQLNPDTGELKCSKLVTGKLQGTAQPRLQHLETEKQETAF